MIMSHDHHVGAGREAFQDEFTKYGPVHRDIGRTAGDLGQPQLIELFGARIDQV